VIETDDKYILDGKKVVKERDLLKWGRWFETANRKVASTIVGKARVSTVFLGMDHSFGGSTPILFETMVFGSKKYEGYEKRYSTWHEAEIGHQTAIREVSNETLQNKLD